MRNLVIATGGVLGLTEKSTFDIDSIEFYEFKNALAHLNRTTMLEEGVTLRDIFSMLDSYPELTKIDAYIPDFMEEYNSCPKSGCVSDNFDTLVIQKVISLSKYDEDIDDSLEDYFDIFATSKTDTATKWGIDLANLDTLLDIPVRLEPSLRYDVSDFRKETNRNEDFYKTTSYPAHYTLYDVIQSLIYELSFHGVKSDKVGVLDDLKQRVKELEDGTCELIPYEDLFKALEAEDKPE